MPLTPIPSGTKIEEYQILINLLLEGPFNEERAPVLTHDTEARNLPCREILNAKRDPREQARESLRHRLHGGKVGNIITLHSQA